MDRVTDEGADSGVSISLDIPARNPELFKNKATDDLLLFLSRHRFEGFTVRELTRRTDHTKTTVVRAIDVLVDNGLVVERRDANSRLVEIDRTRLSVPDDPVLRIPQPEFHEPVKTAVDELRAGLDDLLGIVVYGSVARGQADRRSDVDLWVLVDGGRAESQRAANAIVADLEDRQFDGDRYAFDVDVETVSSVPRYSGDVREIVLSGITVYETSEFETVERFLLEEADDDA